jgi:hypothetical protein
MGELILQKTNSIVMEFCGFDDEKDCARYDIDLGDLDIRDGMTKEALLRKLRDVIQKLEDYDGNIFVVQ